ncbi:sperm microtubule associated protein 2-like [Liolophura sinensis]|uniref:sperm microtubule associated protein 2-like n=1 Tax=Liolophura sinensis TaxID=3198878 RepID=UPI0031586120
MSTTSATRIDLLARPKPTPTGFRQDRRSVYWVDYVPSVASGGTTTCVASARVQELSRSKDLNKNYKGDRPTPIWLVSSAAQNTSPSARTESLSQPKPLSPLYKAERSPYTIVTPGASRATSTARLDALSVPRQKSDLATFRDPTESVSSAALKATASGRVEQLAESKKLHPSYQEEKQIQWPVSDSAMKAIASLRLQQLARPRSRSLLKDDYDPYKVTFAARHAHTTPRVEELAVPLPRKVVVKK